MNSAEILKQIEENVPQIDLTMGLQPGEGLEKLMLDAEVIGYRPDIEQRFLQLVQHVRWVGTAAELTYLMSPRSEAKKPHEPYVLGLGNIWDALDSFVVMTNGTLWEKAYKQVGIKPYAPNHTDRFMEEITDSGRDIILFLPSKLFSHANAKNTLAEFEWLTSNPSQAGNVYIVFGGYELINNNWYLQNRSKFDNIEVTQNYAEAFQAWIPIVITAHPTLLQTLTSWRRAIIGI